MNEIDAVREFHSRVACIADALEAIGELDSSSSVVRVLFPLVASLGDALDSADGAITHLEGLNPVRLPAAQ